MNAWRARMNAWLEPLATACPIGPNAISCIALGFILVAAALLAFAGDQPLFYLLALPVIAVGGLLDAFDGVVARVQHRTSALGDFLDHFFDRIADLSLLSGWIIGSGVRIEVGLPSLVLVSLHSYLGTQIEASFGERSYDETGRGEFILMLVIFPLVAWTLCEAGLMDNRYWNLRIVEWMTLLLAAGALQGMVARFRSGMALASRDSDG